MESYALSINGASHCDALDEHGRTLVRTAEVNFICPHCSSFYETVKAEAVQETLEHEIKCSTCHAPLPPREEQFVLKYFLVRRTSEQMWERLPVSVEA
jgi:predicted RNA-binding Zn-ribbon protein involved in translation (DUF1610 family)